MDYFTSTLDGAEGYALSKAEHDYEDIYADHVAEINERCNDDYCPCEHCTDGVIYNCRGWMKMGPCETCENNH